MQWICYLLPLKWLFQTHGPGLQRRSSKQLWCFNTAIKWHQNWLSLQPVCYKFEIKRLQVRNYRKSVGDKLLICSAANTHKCTLITYIGVWADPNRYERDQNWPLETGLKPSGNHQLWVNNKYSLSGCKWLLSLSHIGLNQLGNQCSPTGWQKPPCDHFRIVVQS